MCIQNFVCLFNVVNSDLFDELEVEYELHNYPTITVYNKICGGFIILYEDDYGNEFEVYEFVGFNNILESPEVDEGDEVDDEDNQL